MDIVGAVLHLGGAVRLPCDVGVHGCCLAPPKSSRDEPSSHSQLIEDRHVGAPDIPLFRRYGWTLAYSAVSGDSQSVQQPPR